MLRISPIASAKSAHLHYVEDEEPGLRRVRAGKSFKYVDEKNRSVTSPETLKRIRALVIPPAWEDVWICASPRGHLQASGRDARGRKQYRYHADWTATRGGSKYERLLAFSRVLPKIRTVTKAHLELPGLSRQKVLAAIVQLLERTLIRIGNEAYAQQNHSYGLTTLRERHVEIHGSELTFHFRGKSKKWHDISLNDRKLARVVSDIQHLPGQELFHFLDDDGSPHKVHSHDVNDYLRELTGDDFTAKDFRTWAGTVEATAGLKTAAPCTSEREAKRTVSNVIQEVAKKLGNTPAVCRRSYIHPIVLKSYFDGKLERMRQRTHHEVVVALLRAA